MSQPLNNNKQSYLGNPLIKGAGVKVEFTKKQILEYERCMNDPIYFIKQYVQIINVDRGLIPFELYPYQENIINTVHDNRFVICKMCRQSGKSTTVASYILHFVNFNPDKKVAILANKLAIAKEILERIKRAFQYLPKWMQQGVAEWNKESITLENGSKIIAAATSSSAVRGDTFNLIMLDEFAFIPPNQAEDFFSSVYPTVSSGNTTKVLIVSCVGKDTAVFTDKGIRTVGDFVDHNAPTHPNIGYEVDRYNIQGHRKSLNSGNVMVNSGRAPTRIIKSTSSQLECSHEHKLWACKDGNYGWHRSGDLNPGDYISVQYGMDIWGEDDSLNWDYTPSSKERNVFDPGSKITPDLAYFLGLFLAEGSVYKTVRNGNWVGSRVTITCGDDVSESITKLGLSYSKTDDVHYSIGSISLARFLEYLGFDLSLKAKTKIIPQKIMSMGRKNMIHFLRGYFDGDGCIGKTRLRVSLASASETMLDQIRMILLNLGILSSKHHSHIPPSDLVSVKSDVWQLQCNPKFSREFLKVVGFGIDRKQKIAENYLLDQTAHRPGSNHDVVPHSRRLYDEMGVKYSRAGMKRGNIHWSRERCLEIQEIEGIVSENIKWEPIREIIESENQVFDFSLDHVENNFWCHSVLYNGILGHQTPKGMNHFYKMWTEAEEGRSDYVPIAVHWTEVPGRDQNWADQQIRNTSIQQFEQEFECLTPETPICLRNKETGEIVEMSIGEAYELIGTGQNSETG
jgi:intein/homing endonuclease